MIYLDNNATTFLDPRVITCLSEEMKTLLANPSSLHRLGREAKKKLESSRLEIAKTLGVKSETIYFNSGGTEGLNFLIRGLSFQSILMTNIEHSSVENTVRSLKNIRLHTLPVGQYGAIVPSVLEEIPFSEGDLLIASAVNSETGVKNDIQALAAFTEKKGIKLLIDAVAWMGKEEISIPSGVTAMVFSGHKFHGPTGAGFIYLKENTPLSSFMTGGLQEKTIRPGTENLLGILGLAKAVSLLKEELPQASLHMETLKKKFIDGLTSSLEGIHINGEGPKISNTVNLAFEKIEGEVLLFHLDQYGIAASHGAACAAGLLAPSRVLLNMGYTRERTLSSLRFSLSRFTTEEEIDKAVEVLINLIKKLRA